MKNITKNVKTQLRAKTAAMTVAFMAAAPMMAMAAGGADAVNAQLTGIMDTVFTLISVALGVFGSFILIPGILAFIKAVTDHEGGDRSAGAQKIAFGVVVILMAVAVKAFEKPILDMITAAKA